MTEPMAMLEVEQRNAGLELVTAVAVLATSSPLLALALGWAWRVFRWAAWG